MPHHLHQRAAVCELGIDGLDQPDGDIALFTSFGDHRVMIDAAGLDGRRRNGRIGIAIFIQGLQTHEQVAGAAQADDLLATIRRVGADLHHALGQGIEIRTGLALHEQLLSLVEFHHVSAVTENAVQPLCGGFRPLSLEFVERTMTVRTAHRTLVPPDLLYRFREAHSIATCRDF